MRHLGAGAGKEEVVAFQPVLLHQPVRLAQVLDGRFWILPEGCKVPRCVIFFEVCVFVVACDSQAERVGKGVRVT